MALRGTVTEIVDGIHYILHAYVVGSVVGFSSERSIQPVTVLAPEHSTSDTDGFTQLWEEYSSLDDVFSLKLTEGLVIQNVDGQTSVPGIWKHVAVPSRLYSEHSEDNPLTGARMDVKDIFDLAGIQSTMMSKTFIELYGPAATNADYVEKLTSKGAVIVGKTKMTASASLGEPTYQYIDFHCPTNPRRDMYQKVYWAALVVLLRPLRAMSGLTTLFQETLQEASVL
ncbi:hypothetical protein M501DRAFT_992062 [Patellaria atrata CBS 101060]|uniref:Amidase domain-containing protein n=1 Tax=Patellaria atrata CBS 101060 TaxID=1346257 RepID=A0A9P4VRP6_9PEZI|nr:hypothetical protein M501DRAFT_992062 [Patellaria atrata CBS 101060]